MKWGHIQRTCKTENAPTHHTLSTHCFPQNPDCRWQTPSVNTVSNREARSYLFPRTKSKTPSPGISSRKQHEVAGRLSRRGRLQENVLHCQPHSPTGPWVLCNPERREINVPDTYQSLSVLLEQQFSTCGSTPAGDQTTLLQGSESIRKEIRTFHLISSKITVMK